jgi:glycosyltransferase involved in cell wall biosynthesis
VRDGENGFTVRNEPGALAEAVSRVLGDDGLHAALSEGARRTGREFSVPATTDRVLEVYGRALASGYQPAREHTLA